ncbi:MAG: phosphatidylglycerophosphatase A [Balneolaceae bacterium]|nr:MAG: phosphatidylglycerophosphatase A [Balneolaceae bacterium]
MQYFKICVGTLFGAGLIPFAPGTWGSFFTLPLIYGAAIASPLYGVPLLFVLTVVLSLWSTDASVEKFGNDPGQFVMDESAGQTATFLFISFSFTLSDFSILVTGFIIFRVFDILKPFGIKAVEKMRGKFGILADDLLAGLYALVCLKLLIHFVPGLV